MKRRHFVFITPKRRRFGVVVNGCKPNVVTVASLSPNKSKPLVESSSQRESSMTGTTKRSPPFNLHLTVSFHASTP